MHWREQLSSFGGYLEAEASFFCTTMRNALRLALHIWRMNSKGSLPAASACYTYAHRNENPIQAVYLKLGKRFSGCWGEPQMLWPPTLLIRFLRMTTLRHVVLTLPLIRMMEMRVRISSCGIRNFCMTSGYILIISKRGDLDWKTCCINLFSSQRR